MVGLIWKTRAKNEAVQKMETGKATRPARTIRVFWFFTEFERLSMIKEKEIPKHHRFPLKSRSFEQLSSGRPVANGQMSSVLCLLVIKGSNAS
jgi:hypothetical protein